MNHLACFDFQTLPVRVIMREGEPWFVATDVCRALEIAHTPHALTRLDGDEKADVVLNDTSGRQRRRTNVVNEFGLYALILGSRKPSARAFKRWVTHEVLPALRRDGNYAIAGAAPQQQQQPAAALPAAISAPAFVSDQAAPETLRLDAIPRVAAEARRLRRAYGLPRQRQDVAGLGAIEVFPPELLAEAYARVEPAIVRKQSRASLTNGDSVGGSTFEADRRHFEALLQVLAQEAPGLALTFGRILQRARELKLFDHLLCGSSVPALALAGLAELPQVRSAFGKLLCAYAGQTFELPGGRSVVWIVRGRNRSRHYRVEVAPSVNGAVVGDHAHN